VREEFDLPPVPGDAPVPTEKEYAKAVEVILSSDHAVMVDDGPPAAEAEESADAMKQLPTHEDEIAEESE
jgi:hypothetical protein